MFNGNIILVDTPDNHSVFMDSSRNLKKWLYSYIKKVLPHVK